MFDLIYSFFSLHHWKDPVSAIQNLYGALKNDGVLLIYDFQRHLLTYYLPFLRKGLLESIRASYTTNEILSVITGLDIDNFQVQSHFPYISITIKK